VGTAGSPAGKLRTETGYLRAATHTKRPPRHAKRRTTKALSYGEPNPGASHGMTAHFCRNFLSKLESRGDGLPDRLLAGGLFLVGLVALVAMARSMGIADGEAPALDAATAYGRLWELWAQRGYGLSALTRDDLRHELGSFPVAPFFPFGLSGYVWLATARRVAGPWLDELVALRLPGVLAAAMVPPLVYSLGRRALGRRFAVLAALFSLVGPRLLVAGASLGGGAWLTAAMLVWFVALDAGEQARADGNRGRALRAAVAAGVALGLALALSWFTLVFLAPLVWSAFRHPREPIVQGAVAHSSRELAVSSSPSAGLLAFSPVVAVAVFVAPLVALLSTPALLPPDADAILSLFQRALEPSFASARAVGLLPDALVPPRLHVIAALLITLPSTTLALALVGAVVGLRLRATASDRWLALVSLVVGVSIVAPRALSSYPSPYLLAVPWLALLAASAVRWIVTSVRAASGEGRRLFPAVAVVLVLAEPLFSTFGFGAAATAPAAFPLLIAAPSPEIAARVAPFDTAMIGHRAMAASLDRVCPSMATGPRFVRVFAPTISPAAWEPLRRFHRLSCPFVPVRRLEDAELVILGPADADAGLRTNADVLAVPGTLRGRRTLLRFWRRKR
jgi:hypothetical protein